MGIFGADPAEATTIIYASTTGTGTACTLSTPCSLTEALSSAASGDSVELYSGTYTGNFALPSVTVEPVPGQTAAVQLNGGGVIGTSVVAVDESGVNATLENITVTNGDGAWGGAIYNIGTLTVVGSAISDSTATGGAGGRHYGGGIYNDGTLTVETSTITGNTATGDAGGGIFNDVGGVVTIDSSTIAGNVGGYDGGGIYNYEGTLTVEDSTFSGNSASVANGGAILNGGGTATIESSTLSDNTAGYLGAEISNGGTLALAGDIVGMPGGPPATGECQGTAITDDGYNVDDDASCSLTAPTSINNSSTIDAYLGPLGANGGPTETVPLLVNSSVTPSPGPDPALGAVPSSFVLPTGEAACSDPDQRGVTRASPCDMGAFELPSDAVAFNSEGGAAVASLRGPDGGSITLPSDTYPGYVFDGWFTAASGGTEVGGAGSSYTVPVGGITLYAQWTENTIDTVAFNPTGGVGVASLSGPDGSSITLPSDTYPGYSFDGWFTLASGGPEVGGAGSSYTIPSGGITLYAHWTAIDTVAFNSNGGAAVASLSGPDGSSITLPSDTNPGYSLGGWFTQASGGTEVGGAGSSYTVPVGGITLYAQWTENTIDTVAFNPTGGVGVASLSGPDGSSITLPSDTRPGDSFDGWFTAASSGTEVGGAGSSYSIPVGGITLYAHWTENTIDAVAFNSDGGAAVASLSGPDGSSITLPSDTYPGYVFDGWFTQASGGTKVGGAGSSYTIPSGGITLDAQWTENTIDAVAFNSTGGAAVASLSGPDGSSITLPSDTYPGYVFDGWFTQASGGTKVGGAGSSYTVPVGGITLDAQWTENTIDAVAFNSTGGAAVASLSGPDGSSITLPSDTYPGYVFDGWFTQASGGTKVGGAGSPYTIPSDGITLDAQWTENTIDTVFFNSEGGAAVPLMMGPDGSSITLPSDTYPGYVFDGWFTAASGGTKVGGAGSSYAIPVGGITLFAQWTAIDSVAFNSEGGAAVPLIMGPDGSSITLPSDTYPGYVFDGWFTAASGGTEVGGAGSSYAIPVGGITLFAQWTAIDSVAFNSEGGAAVPLIMGPDGSSITLPSDTYPGYVFDGWFTAASGGTKVGGAGSSYAIPVGGITLFAQWTAIDSVAFNSEGGAAVPLIMGPDGSSITLPSDTYPGYVFDGWFTQASGGTEVGGAGSSYTVPVGGITLDAHWTENTIDAISFVSDGGAAVPLIMGPDGSSITLPSDTRPGYSLDGWFTQASGGTKIGGPGSSYTIPVGGITLFAQWTENTIDAVAFNSNGGAVVASLSGPDGGSITLPSDTRSGYVFDGWFTQASGGTEVGGAGSSYAIPVGGITLFAQWTENTIDAVAFNSEGGAAVASLSGPDGGSITLPSDTRPGYVFDGWFTQASGGTKVGGAGSSYAIPVGGITLFAQWTAIDAVAFNSEGGAAVASLSGPDGSSITLPSDTYPGYVFDGWFTAASGGTKVGGAESAYTVPVGGITLFAQWTSIGQPPSPPPPAHGYWLVGSDGGIFTFGSAQFHGSTGSLVLQRPVVGIVPTKDDGGYWLDASDGGVFSFGDTQFYGSIPGLGLHPAGSGLPNSLNAPIVGMVPSIDDHGYFMVASDGGVFAFGDAHFAGSCPGIGGCSGAAVAVMPDASGNGYWLVTQTGSVYTFGDAPYFGAPGHGTVTSAVATPDGKGYWVLMSDGEVYAYGDAGNLGYPSSDNFYGPDAATAIFATSDGAGYWVSSALGAVFNYGDAPNDGGMAGTHLNGAIIAATGF